MSQKQVDLSYYTEANLFNKDIPESISNFKQTEINQNSVTYKRDNTTISVSLRKPNYWVMSGWIYKSKGSYDFSEVSDNFDDAWDNLIKYINKLDGIDTTKIVYKPIGFDTMLAEYKKGDLQ